MQTSTSDRTRRRRGRQRPRSGQTPSAEAIVVRWVEAFNARDLDGMLAYLAEEVDLHPLRLGGAAGRYRGHAGVREWFKRIAQAYIECRIILDQTRELGGGKVFASGSLSVGEEPGTGPFCALHRVQRGLIIDARQYVSDPAMVKGLGLIS